MKFTGLLIIYRESYFNDYKVKNIMNRKNIFIKIRHSLIIILVNLLNGTHFFTLKSFLLKLNGYVIGKSVKIVGPVFIGSQVFLSIKDNVWIGRNFNIFGNGQVIINQNCDIAPNCSLLTGSHEIGNTFKRAGKGIKYKIVIGSGTWIGFNATLLGNIMIGDGSVIGANSLVIKSTLNNSLNAGIPTKIIKNLE